MSSRVETLIKALTDDSIAVPKPQSRFECWLYKALGYDVKVTGPQSRVEALFKAASEQPKTQPISSRLTSEVISTFTMNTSAEVEENA